MAEKVILNGEPYTMTEKDLPCLITYGEHMGGSHFSIALVSNLFLSDSKILFLTAHPMARENFLEQVGIDHSGIAFIDSISDLRKSLNTQAIVLKSGDEALFLEAVKMIPDLQQRVVLIKNMEVFSEAVFNTILNLEKIILSGDIDACISKEEIVKKNFKTKIAFNQPETDIGISVPILEKYTGFLAGVSGEGVIFVKKS